MKLLLFITKLQNIHAMTFKNKLFLTVFIFLLSCNTKSHYSNLPQNTHTEYEEPEFICIVEAMPMPEFIGGHEAFFTLVEKNIQYPADARENGIEGTVYVGFDIEADGNISNVHIKRGISGWEILEIEAMRLIRLMPKWKPGMQRGKAVKVAFIFPIRFKLSEQ
ncbi:MAG: energy transducer TonB [Chitinophagales bacterium]